MWIHSTADDGKKEKTKPIVQKKTQKQPMITGWENLPPIGVHIDTIPREGKMTIVQIKVKRKQIIHTLQMNQNLQKRTVKLRKETMGRYTFTTHTE